MAVLYFVSGIRTYEKLLQNLVQRLIGSIDGNSLVYIDLVVVISEVNLALVLDFCDDVAESCILHIERYARFLGKR